MYSAIAHDHFANPRNAGTLENPTHEGTAGVPGDGPYMVLRFEVVDGVIVRAGFRTFGCPAAIACASMATEVAKGRSIETVLKMTADDLSHLLGGLPEGKGHCPRLAVEALRKAFEGENIA